MVSVISAPRVAGVVAIEGDLSASSCGESARQRTTTCMLAPSDAESAPAVPDRCAPELEPAVEPGAGRVRSTWRLGGREEGIALGGRRAGGPIAARRAGGFSDMPRER